MNDHFPKVFVDLGSSTTAQSRLMTNGRNRPLPPSRFPEDLMMATLPPHYYQLFFLSLNPLVTGWAVGGRRW